MQHYDIPEATKELFDNGEVSYCIIDTDEGRDNVASMQLFIDLVDIPDGMIIESEDTQIVVRNSTGKTLQIDAGGLGDFFSHGYEVSDITGREL